MPIDNLAGCCENKHQKHSSRGRLTMNLLRRLVVQGLDVIRFSHT